MAFATELKKTNGENEIRKSGGNRVEDLPGSFAGNLRVAAEEDASAFELLLTPYAFYVVFLPCVSISVYFSSFLLLCFQNKPILSLGQFCFCCFRPVLMRERLTSGLGFNQKT